MTDQRSIVSNHAVKRFIERVMEMPSPEIVPKTAKDQITEKVLNLLNEHYPLHEQLSSGSFKISDLGIVIVKDNDRVVTIKQINNDEAPSYRGGVMKSGSKKKKGLNRRARKDQ